MNFRHYSTLTINPGKIPFITTCTVHVHATIATIIKMFIKLMIAIPFDRNYMTVHVHVITRRMQYIVGGEPSREQ